MRFAGKMIPSTDRKNSKNHFFESKWFLDAVNLFGIIA